MRRAAPQPAPQASRTRGVAKIDTSMRPGPSPTQQGDVLILCTSKTFTICIVGVVVSDGQQDFSGRTGLFHAGNVKAGIRIARQLASPPRRIFVVGLEGGWRQVADDESE